MQSAKCLCPVARMAAVPQEGRGFTADLLLPKRWFMKRPCALESRLCSPETCERAQKTENLGFWLEEEAGGEFPPMKAAGRQPGGTGRQAG